MCARDVLAEIRARKAAFLKVASAYWRYESTDIDYLSVLCSVFVTNRWKHDPVWLLVIGPPGAGKTDPLMCLSGHPDVFMVGKITPQTLISGWHGSDQSILPTLNGKFLILKDFSTMLQMEQSKRDAVIGQLREAYDGQLGAGYGIGGADSGIKEHRAHFTIIAACVPAYEHYYSVNQQLGERFVTFRFRHVNPEAAAYRALANQSEGPERKKEIRIAFKAYLDATLDAPLITDTTLSHDQETLIVDSASLTARARTHVHRDGYSKEVSAAVCTETPTRLSLQIAKVAKGTAVSNGRLVVAPADMRLAMRLAMDSIPALRFAALSQLCAYRKAQSAVMPNTPEAHFISVSDMAASQRVSVTTMRRQLEDLYVCGLLRQQDEGRHRAYAIRGKYYRVMRRSRLCE